MDTDIQTYRYTRTDGRRHAHMQTRADINIADCFYCTFRRPWSPGVM